MTEAELRIKPVLAGLAKWRSGVGGLKRDVGGLGRTQVAELARGRHEAVRLERAFERTGHAARSIGTGLKGTVSSLMSLKTLAVGALAGGAGKTVFDGIIGSNAKLEAQKITFNTLVGDVVKADALLARVRQYAADTPFQQDDLIDGSKSLLRLTKDNADENMRLLKIAGQFAAINPTKTVGDAVEAILDAEGMEFERLKEFGIKLGKKDIEKMRKRGESMGQAALRGVEEALTKQTGGRDPVAALSKSFNGKLSTFKDQFKEFVRKGGEPAFNVLKDGMDDVAASFAELGADPEFKKDMEELAGYAVDIAKGSLSLAKNLPTYLRDLKEFGAEYGGVLKLMAGGYAVNKLTGGAAARGGGALLASGARGLGRAFFGRRGGGTAGALAGGAGAGAMPVYVVNMGEGGGGLGDALGGAGKGAAGAAAGGVGATSYTGGAVGITGVAGGAIAAGAAAGLVTAGGALATFLHTNHKIGKLNEKIDAKAEAEAESRFEYHRSRLATHFADMVEPVDKRLARERRSQAERAATSLRFKGGAGGGAGGARYRLEQTYATLGSGERAGFVEQANAALADQGVSVRFGADGKIIASSRQGAGFRGQQAAAALNRSTAVQPGNYVPGLGDAQAVAKNIGEGLKIALGPLAEASGLTVIVQGDLTREGAQELEQTAKRARRRRKEAK